MLVRSDRTYHFPVDPRGLWTTLEAVERYPLWWPWLRQLDAGALAAGATWACTVQPPLPYVLRFVVELLEVVPPRLVQASVTGDVVGEARIDVDPRPDGCAVRLTSRLAPGNRALQAVATVARPIVRFGHDWVIDTGARQFSERALGPP